MNCVCLFFVLIGVTKALPILLEEHDVEDKSEICSHKYPLVSEIPHFVKLEEKENWHKIVRREIEHNLRIKVFYHESVQNLTTVKKRIVKDQVVPAAVSFWEKALKVRRNFGTIRLNRKCENNQYFLAPDDPIQYCKNSCVETKCGEFVVPEQHLGSCHVCNSRGRNCSQVTDEGEGVKDVDFILYVSAIPTVQCGTAVGQEASTVAYAAHCQQEENFDRPIAGHTNICPSAIKNSKASVLAMTSTVQHELLHALGFSSSLFAFYRDKKGNPLTPRREDGKPPINRRLQVRQWSDKVIMQIDRPWKVRKGNITKKVNLVVTPRVVDEVRKHFNCSTLEGAELEDQGGDGTSLTHWEKRLFQNEAMTGTVHTQMPIYSRVTFALLEDSGWYLPNYDMAKDIMWGKNMGCDFAKKSCMELMEQQRKKPELNFPFCDSLMQSSARTTCTFDKSSVGSCNLVKFRSTIPEEYQNFKELGAVNASYMSYIGSSVTLADFCPYIQEFSWKSGGSNDNRVRGTRCTNEENSPTESVNYALESYGQGSKCFEQGDQWEQKDCYTLKQWKRYGAGCYEYKCEDGLVNIVVRNVTFPCEAQGQKLDISLKEGKWLHTGSLICPKCEDLCDECAKGNKSEIDVKSLKEDLKGTCFSIPEGLGNLGNFLKGFGISLGD